MINKLSKIEYEKWNIFAENSSQVLMLPGVEQIYRRFGRELISYKRIWNDNFFNYAKSQAKKIRYGRS